MHGSLSIGSKAARAARSADARMYLAMGAVGVLSGLLVTHGRLGLGLPGHKALFWIVPVLAMRLACRLRAGASVGALAAAATTMALGGNLAGGVLLMPLIVLAGAVLDVAVGLCRRWGLRPWAAVGVLALAGAAGNLLCAVKRLAGGLNPLRAFAGFAGPWATVVSYAAFGLAAGALGAAIGYGLLSIRRRGESK